MPRLLTIVVIASQMLSAQMMVDPARVASLVKSLERRSGEASIRCEVIPIKPALNFGFRFQAGYVVHVPLEQYFGSGHKLAVLARVTPQSGDRKPVFLMNLVSLPKVPKTKLVLEIVGSYLLGEGRYSVDWTLFDEKMRVCRKEWRADAELKHSERRVRVAMTRDTVADLSLRGSAGVTRDADDAYVGRLTVLVHAAPMSPRRTILRASDKMLLLGTLSSLIERLPSRSLRLVVFNLDQQKEIFRRDSFAPEALGQVMQALNELELGSVDYSVLKNRRGHVDLLADLVNQELAAKDPSDEVVFLGPPARFSDKAPQGAFDKPRSAGPRFFYFELKPFFRSQSDFPDSIHLAVNKLKGKAMIIHTPGEFAKAIEQVEQAASPASREGN